MSVSYVRLVAYMLASCIIVAVPWHIKNCYYDLPTLYIGVAQIVRE